MTPKGHFEINRPLGIQVFALFILEFEFTSYTWDVGFLPGVFFSSFVFIYVTIQDRGDIIGYYYSTLGNSFVPCFSCRKQQENNMFVFLVTKQLQKTTTLFSCRKHKKQQEWNRRSQPMFKSISVWLLRLKKWKDIKQKEKIWKALVVGVYHVVCLQNKISSELNLGPLIWGKLAVKNHHWKIISDQNSSWNFWKILMSYTKFFPEK